MSFLGLLDISYPSSSTLLALSLALTLPACVVPKVLGPNEVGTESDTGEGSTSEGSTSEGETGESSTSEGETGAPPVCEAGGGEAGVLAWALSGDELPAFSRAVAVDPSERLVLAGSVVVENGDLDLRVDVRGDDGIEAWLHGYGGAFGLDDLALDVAVDGAGNIHALYRETILSLEEDMYETSDARLVVLRYDPAGEQIWRWEQEHADVEIGNTYAPEGALAIVDGAPRVLVRAPGEPTLVIALDDLGEEVSTATLAAPAGLSVERAAIASDGRVFVAGDLEGEMASHELWLGGFADDGALLWSDQFGGLDDSPTALIPDPEAGVLLAWSTSLPGGVDNHLRRYDGNGAALWSAAVPLSGLDSGIAAGAIACDGVVLLTGASDRDPAPESAWGFRRELWVAAYGLDGVELWSTFHAFGDVESYGEGIDVAALANGDAIVVGNALAGDGATSLPWLGRFGGG
ncbi:MAG: hypothetical protein H6711_31495 [Myxococcales bacterium]|nr:hypothetical protein [Myxococcales bacterium]